MGFFGPPNIKKLESKGDIEGLIKALKFEASGQEAYDIRDQAAGALIRLGEPSVKFLIEALKNRNRYAREQAALALGKIRDARAVEPLLQVLVDENGSGRGEAALALGEIGDTRVVEPLIQALKNEDTGVRKDAVIALGKIRDARAVEPLLQVLMDDIDESIRDQAAWALGEIGDVRVVESLIQALEDKARSVHLLVAEALSKIGDTRAILPLTKALKDEHRHFVQGNRVVQGDRMEQAWKKIAEDERAVEFLIQVLNDEDNYIRTKAAGALVNIGESSVESLIKVMDDNDVNARGLAAKALGNIGDARAVEALVDALKYDYNDGVRVFVAEALGKINDTRAVAPLIQALRDEDSYIRTKAAGALVNIGESSVESLIKVMDDNDVNVRMRAAETLDKLHWKPSTESNWALFLIAKQNWSQVEKLGKPVVAPLIDVLKDVDAGVRKSAVIALGNIGDASILEPLIKALKDGDAGVRMNAVIALGKLGNTKALEALVDALKDEDAGVRKSAVIALGNIGDARAIAPLLEYMFANPDPTTGHEEKALRKMVSNSNLTEDIIRIAAKAAEFQTFYVEQIREDPLECLEDSNRVVKALCSNKSPVISNLLILISQRSNIPVTISSGPDDRYEEIVDFSQQRQMAIDELTQRGSPPYDPSAFLKASE